MLELLYCTESSCQEDVKKINNNPIHLKKKFSMSEVLVFQHLFENIGSPVNRNDLLQKGWPDKIVTHNSLNVAIRSLRSKFQNAPFNQHISINTIPGIGYSLDVNSNLVNIKFDEEGFMKTLIVKK